MASILFGIVRNCGSQFKCSYLDNEKMFHNVLFYFWNLHEILNILKKKMIAIANVFPKLQTVKEFVRSLSRKRRFRTPFDSQHIKGSKHLSNLHESAFIDLFITLRECHLENLFLSDMWNLRSVW